MPPDNAEILIIGGGLAGSAAAIQLARAGRNVLLVDRESQAQHKVCGEFLSAEALGFLQLLGVDTPALGAVSIQSFLFCGKVTPLPFVAQSLTRKTLDEAMLNAACQVGVTVSRGTAVQELRRVGDAWVVVTNGGQMLSAKTVFLATGKHDLRGRLRPSGEQSDLTGFKMYYDLSKEQTQALDGRVELFLFRGGYAGLQLVEQGVANLCCVVEKAVLQNNEGSWNKLLIEMQRENPGLSIRLKGAEPLLQKPLAISSIPYGFVRELTEPGLWCVGDQAAVIPSFTGDGMSIALHSGMLAVEMYVAGSTSQQFQSRLRSQVQSQVAFATWISKAMVRPSGRLAMRYSSKFFPRALSFVAARTRLSV